MGFIAADGFVGRKVASIVIGLAKKDIHHLERFLKFIGHPGKPKINKYNGGAYIEFKSRVLHTALSVLWITNKKSARESAPEILKHDRDFWRGYVDGDGSFYWLSSRNNSPVFKLLGSKVILTQFAEFIYLQLGIKPRKIQRSIGIFVITYGGAAARLIAKHLYAKSEIALSRKRAIAEKMYLNETRQIRYPNGRYSNAMLLDEALIQLQTYPGAILLDQFGNAPRLIYDGSQNTLD